MARYAATTARTSTSAAGGASTAAMAARAACSRARAATYGSRAGSAAKPVAARPIASPKTAARFKLARTCSSQLGVDFLEVLLVDQHFARLAAVWRRHQAFHFHHVHQAGGAA